MNICVAAAACRIGGDSKNKAIPIITQVGPGGLQQEVGLDTGCERSYISMDLFNKLVNSPDGVSIRQRRSEFTHLVFGLKGMGADPVKYVVEHEVALPLRFQRTYDEEHDLKAAVTIYPWCLVIRLSFPQIMLGKQDIYQFGFNEVDLNQTNVHEALGNFPWSRKALENLGAQFAPSAEIGDFLDEGAEPGESIKSPSLHDSIKAEAKRGLTFSDETTNYWLKKALAEMSNDCTTAQKERAKQILVAHQDLFSTTLRKGRDNFIVGVEAAFQVDRSEEARRLAEVP